MNTKEAKFTIRMNRITQSLLTILLLTGLLQSCYTMLNPPLTLPETVSNMISEPVIVSSLGGSGYYGWDPYWEPVLPYTNYNRGFGNSYYSPYNYYDYHHSYYRPIYVTTDNSIAVQGRDFGRGQNQGAGRERTDKPNSALDVNTAAPAVSGNVPISVPPTTSPILQPSKPRKQTEVRSEPNPVKQDSSPKQKRVRSSSSNSKSKESSSSSSSAKNTRKRTRK
jgi:hypothetical protein